DAGWHGAYPQLARTEEVRGSNPLTSTPYNCRSGRRPLPRGGALVVPGTAWGHTGATAGLPTQPNHGRLGGRPGGAVERIQAVAEGGIGLRVQVAVAIQGEAHRGGPSPSRGLLGIGTGRDPPRHRR